MPLRIRFFMGTSQPHYSIQNKAKDLVHQARDDIEPEKGQQDDGPVQVHRTVIEKPFRSLEEECEENLGAIERGNGKEIEHAKCYRELDKTQQDTIHIAELRDERGPDPYEQEKQVGDDGRDKVGGGPSQGDESRIAARVFERPKIDHHGACPSDMKQQESDGPQRVQMAQRVQAEAPCLDGSHVAKFPRHPRMSILMDRNNDQDDRYLDKPTEPSVLDIGQKSLHVFCPFSTMCRSCRLLSQSHSSRVSTLRNRLETSGSSLRTLAFLLQSTHDQDARKIQQGRRGLPAFTPRGPGGSGAMAAAQ